MTQPPANDPDGDGRTGGSRRHIPWHSVIPRLVVIAVAWWILTEGRGLYQWPVALLVIAAATWASLALKVGDRQRMISIWAVALFVPVFLKQSLLGGIDVARRAFTIRRRVRPAWAEMKLHLVDEPSRVFLASVLSLMPGTLSVQLHGRELRIHVLDESLVSHRHWRGIEQRVARIFRDPGDAGAGPGVAELS